MYKNNKAKKSKERRHNNRPPSHNRQIKHSKDKDCEWWSDYDSRGNIIHRNTIYNSGKVVEYWIKYEGNREIHFRRNDGFQYWCKYNKYGNIIRYWDTSGYEATYSYYPGVVYMKDNHGQVIKKKYDREKNGCLTIHNF